jgi:NAD(P)-dependent dehydrogenase (short-subunit alcohol dehydrogenase family)
MAPTPDLSVSGWRDALDVNLTGAFLCAKHQIPAMQARGGGSIIFTSTFVGHTVGFPGMAAYAASKAGLIGLTQVVATEFGAQKIRASRRRTGPASAPSRRGSPRY